MFQFRAVLAIVILSVSSSVFAQSVTHPPRDARALLLLQQSFASMGGAVPNDSVAKGSITIVEGSTTEAGTIRILSRGLTQTAEFIDTPEGKRYLIQNGPRAIEDLKGTTKELPLELSVTSQAPYFPALITGALLSSPDAAVQYVGLERLEGREAHHLQFWMTFPETPALKHLEQFSTREMWIDAHSGLPVKLSYKRYVAVGPDVPMEIQVEYDDYRSAGRVAFPFHIKRYLNGMLWANISIQQVSFDNGLTDSDFSPR